MLNYLLLSNSQLLPTYIASSKTQNTSSVTSLVINKPSGTQENDLMIAFMANTGAKSGSTWTGDTGWTEIAEQGTGTTTNSLRIAYKVAGASEGSSYTFTASNNYSPLSGAIVTYRSASYDKIGTITTGTDPLVPSGITVAQNNSLLIGFAVVSAASITFTSTMTNARVTDNDATSISFIICDEPVSAGSSGSRSFTHGTSNLSAAVLLAIKPA